MERTTITRKFMTPVSGYAGARLVAITSLAAGLNNRTIASHLSIAMAMEGKRVCLIKSDSESANPSVAAARFSLQELLDGRKTLSEIVQSGPTGVTSMPMGDTLFQFHTLSSSRQQQLVDTLKQLERTFDCLLMENLGGTHSGLVQLLRPVPLIVLTITRQDHSLTGSFSLLQALTRKSRQQRPYIIVDSPYLLPDAHNLFKRFQRAASRYLQITPHYLGYIPSHPPAESLPERPQAMIPTCGTTDRCIGAIAERFCNAVEGLDSSNALSDYFQSCCNAASAALDIREADRTTGTLEPMRQSIASPTLKGGVKQKPGGSAEGLSTAMQFAMRLETRRKTTGQGAK